MQSQRWRRRWWRLWPQTYAKKRTFLFCPRSIYFLFLFLHLCVRRSSDQLTGFHVCFGLPVKRIICASSKLHGISGKLSDDQQNTTPTAYAQKNARVYYSTLNEIHRKQDDLLAPTVFFFTSFSLSFVHSLVRLLSIRQIRMQSFLLAVAVATSMSWWWAHTNFSKTKIRKPKIIFSRKFHL